MFSVGIERGRKHPCFRYALKSNDIGRSSSQSLFVEDLPPTTTRLLRTVARSFFRLMRLSQKQGCLQAVREFFVMSE
jgi:hypothetical protein